MDRDQGLDTAFTAALSPLFCLLVVFRAVTFDSKPMDLHTIDLPVIPCPPKTIEARKLWNFDPQGAVATGNDVLHSLGEILSAS
jgi:hypothetical protein